MLRPTQLHIDLQALADNLAAVRAQTVSAGSKKIMAVVKANAYGHGLVECGRVLEEHGTDALAVAFPEEGVALRSAGISTPILVFGGLSPAQLEQYFEYDLEFTAPSIAKLEQIEAAAKARGQTAKIHLKFDTGMERIGTHYYSSDTLIERARCMSKCEIVGLYSHFASAESDDLTFTKLQLERFLDICERFNKQTGTTPTRHISNSGSIIQLLESSLDMVRPGLLLYGIAPNLSLKDKLSLSPVMKLRSEIVYHKIVAKGDTVSYGRAWTAKEDTRIATVPVGYGDGYPRRLSNRGPVLLRGRRYPIVGTICMDMLMIDVGDDSAYNGDEITLWGAGGEHPISVEEIAEMLDTTPHEIVTSMNMRIPRVFSYQGRQWNE